MAIRFDNLPLFEVTIRLTLADPLPVGFPLVLDLVGSLTREVVVEDALIEVVPGAPHLHSGYGPAVILGFEGGCSVHLQPYLLAARWRGKGSDLYVGFADLRTLLDQVMQALAALLGLEPPVSVVNMTYSNFVAGEIRPMMQDGLLRSDDGWDTAHWESLWRSEGTDLRVVVDRGRHEALGGEGFVLASTAGRILGEGETYVSALERIHEILCNKFVEMITDEAKRLWQFKNT